MPHDSLVKKLATGQISYFKKLPDSSALVQASKIQSGLSPDTTTSWKRSPGYSSASGFARLEVTSLNHFRLQAKTLNIDYKILSETPEFNIVECAAESQQLEKLIKLSTVIFADSKKKLAKEETMVSWHDLTVNRFNTVPGTGGANLTVSVKERAIDTTDIDFRSRYLISNLEHAEVSQHANQIATIIAGAGNTSPLNRGVSWKSKVVSASFDNLLPDPAAGFQTLGITVQNHSYGTLIENSYGSEARAYDLSTIANPNLLHVFSIGNLGLLAGTESYAGIPHYATSTGNFKMAKNLLVVGSHYRDMSIDVRNSRGPAYDGRLLPHFVAFGEGGTSDGAAMVSGLGLLIQDEHQKKFGTLPNAATVKSLMMVGADDIGPQGIDYQVGYGVINARKTLQSLVSGNLITWNIPPNSPASHTLSVPPNIGQLRVAICWLDPAAASGTQSALIHNLDMELEALSSGAKWKPWVLSAYAHADSLAAPAKRKTDIRNNAEYITIDNPASGDYNILITSGALTTPSQAYSIAYYFEEANHFEWTHPVANETAEPGATIFLRWDGTATGQTMLEYTTDGTTWHEERLATLDSGLFKIKLPAEVGRIKFRLAGAFQIHESEWLTLTPPVPMFVGFNCPERVMLNWPPVLTATAYRVYALTSTLMEEVATVTDTVFIFQKNQLTSKHFAVEPILPEGRGFRSLTYQYELQGSDCYIKSFLASLDVDRVNLSIDLSTTYQVNKVAFQRLEKNFVGISEKSIEKNPFAATVDTQPMPGISFYRAEVLLDDGQTVASDTAIIYYADETIFQVFPNPVSRGENISIFTDGEAIGIEFYDANGNKNTDSEVVGTLFRTEVNIDFPPGLYLYRILRNGVPKKSGRIIVK